MTARSTSIVASLALLIALNWAGAAFAASGYEVYAVREGDTLAAIAQRFGISASRIAEANGLRADSPLTPGQSLTVPSAPEADVGAKAQDRFAAEEKEARDVADTALTIKPAAQARSGPVVGYLGIASEKTTALVDPRTRERLCSIASGANLCVSCQYGDYYGVLMVDGALAWVPKAHVSLQAVELVAGIEVPAGATGRSNVIRAAFRYYGLPYLYGGVPPGPTDCSGFVQAAFRECGILLPRTAAEQFMAGYAVPFDQLAVGDRVYFFAADGSIGHTGIYTGNGQFIHASSRRGYVGVDSLRSGFYRSRLAGARRP